MPYRCRSTMIPIPPPRLWTRLLLCGVISPHPAILLAHRSRLATGAHTMEDRTGAFLQVTLFFHAIWHLMPFGSERGLPLTVKNLRIAPGGASLDAAVHHLRSFEGYSPGHGGGIIIRSGLPAPGGVAAQVHSAGGVVMVGRMQDDRLAWSWPRLLGAGLIVALLAALAGVSRICAQGDAKEHVHAARAER